jgi:hypothetical protein
MLVHIGQAWLCVSALLDPFCHHVFHAVMFGGSWTGSLHPAQWRLSQLSFLLAQLSPAVFRDSAVFHAVMFGDSWTGSLHPVQW